MVKLANKWQNFAQVGLQLKFSFRIRLLDWCLTQTLKVTSLSSGQGKYENN